MKYLIPIGVISAMIMVGLPSIQAESEKSIDEKKASHKKHPHKHHHKMMKMLKKKFDADKDGKLSEEERDELKAYMEEHHPEMARRHQEKIDEFDVDGDGKLSEEERKAMKKKHCKKCKKQKQ